MNLLPKRWRALTAPAWLASAFMMMTPANAASLPTASLVPGGIALLPVAASGDHAPAVYYRDQRVIVIRTDQGWTAVVGIPLETKPGVQTAQARGTDLKLVFNVEGKAYEVQHITLSNQRMVTPAEADLKRIREETARMTKIYRHWTDVADLPLPFQSPISGRQSSAFGLRRVFNGESRNPHSGLDIAAPKGTPVGAPAEGTVVNTGDYYFNGRTVFIDHGQGLITMYCHLDEIRVHEGQKIKRGDILGTVGMSGRATGAHLHWTVSINDARVDPRLFLAPD